MSKCNGSEYQCVAWLNKAEEYFDIYNIQSNEEKVKYASMYMKGYAYNCYMWWKGDNFSYSWNLFKNHIFKRFQGIAEDEFFRKLTGLKQDRSIEEFTHQWESLLTQVFHLSDKQRLETYLGGFKPYLQKELELHDIPNVEVARHKAKAAECKLEVLRKR